MNRLFTRLARRVGLLLYALRLHPLVIWLGRRRPKVLVYHACDPDPGLSIRELGINTPPSDLESQLDYLSRHYRVVSLSQLEVAPALDGIVALSFDDGYRSVFTHAFPLLRDRGLTATVYLVSGTLDDGPLVWVNELAWWVNAHPEVSLPVLECEYDVGPGTPVASIIEAVCSRFDGARVQSLLTRIRAASPPAVSELAAHAPLYIQRDEIDLMAASGFTFGNHSRSHPDLARLTKAQQREELTGAQNVIARLPGGCNSLAYPFGSYSQATRELCAELGFSSVMEVGGTNSPLRLDRVSRVPVGRGGAAELFAQMEIITPLKSLARRWIGRAQRASA